MQTDRHESKWKPGVKGIADVPYRLDELCEDASDKTVFIFEGEKDVDRALSNGLSATCNAGGAGNWKPELNDFLKDRKICIVPDNDTPGLNHAQKLLDDFVTDNIEAFILTSHLPELPDKGDFSDWMDTHKDDIDAFLSLVKLDRENKTPPEQAYLDKFGIKPANALFHMHFDPLNFLYDGLIPSVGLTILAALPKTGKSWLVLNTYPSTWMRIVCLSITWLQRTTRGVSNRVLRPYSMQGFSILRIMRSCQQSILYHEVMTLSFTLNKLREAQERNV